MWKDLNAQQKADLMDIFLSKGITSLSEMQNFYDNSNRYSSGEDVNRYGDEENLYFTGGPKKRWNTTGGAGYVPQADVVSATKKAAYDYMTGGLPLDVVRQRLYDNVSPKIYLDATKRFRDAVVKNTPDEYIKNQGHDQFRDDIWAEYLSIPHDERHFESYSNPIFESDYSPTVRTDKNKNKYYTVDLNSLEKEDLYNAAIYGKGRNGKALKLGENGVYPTLRQYFGNHTIGRGYDGKGEYISFYDNWNLSPIYHAVVGYNGKDESMGIGKPIQFYDRMYLDDYFDVEQPTHATYLPELTVTGKRRACGGKLHGYGGPLLEMANRYGY